MKTKEELNALRKEVEALNKKLQELTEEEFAQISGGSSNNLVYYCPNSECEYLKTKGKQFEVSLEGCHTKLRCHYCDSVLKIRW